MSKKDHFQFTPGVDICQPLTDQSRTGKARPWTEHRSSAELLSVVYTRINGNRAKRVRDCAPLLAFAVDAEGNKRLKTAWFCRVRLCPVCQWRRSLKIYGQAVQVIEAADKQKAHGWIMLTLTVKNVDGIDLSNELDLLMESWRRLTRSKEWKKRVLGSMRSLEVTHNLKLDGGSYDTYHPHIHALLCVEPSYFAGRNYMSRDKWTDLWAAAAGLEYRPQVYVSKVKGTSAKALAEVAKYATKTADYILPDDLDLMEDTVRTLDAALDHRRLISWQGNLRQIRTQLGLDDIDQGDLVHTADEDQAIIEEHVAYYQWIAENRQYYLAKGEPV